MGEAVPHHDFEGLTPERCEGLEVVDEAARGDDRDVDPAGVGLAAGRAGQVHDGRQEAQKR